MASIPKFVHLSTSQLSLVFDCTRQLPVILYFGAPLEHTEDPSQIIALSTRQEAKCALIEEVALSVTPTLGHGFTGHPGLVVNNAQTAWSTGPRLHSVEQTSSREVVFTSVDEVRGIELTHSFSLAKEQALVSCNTQLTNTHTLPLQMDYCAAPTFYMPDHLSRITSFEGRWSMEFQQTDIDLFLGAYVRENRKGKTSHDNFPGVILKTPFTNEAHGECFAFHLGWSGNHRTRVELLPEQRTYVQLGELLNAQEVTLAQGESYTSPTLYVAHSQNGLSDLSAQFHRYIRTNILSERVLNTPRPIHYNTWEGIYFEHDIATLCRLAEKVAEIGAERFVLDDGWFKGRRNDAAGLGDWIVDKSVYPDGLAPLIEHVEQLGMSFGIWFEPEMVNPDSDLYREHPDWVLQTHDNPQIQFRNQYVLDLSRPEVFAYVYQQIADILLEYSTISYIKWDMNRDINHTGGASGYAVVHQQTRAVYRMINALKAEFPHVDIESCSSGGARIDLGILPYTDRFWTSDSNDALDRLMIQRGCSFFIPPEIMGSHVGPRDCHITGRHLPIETRAAVALFGSFGMEMDPRELTEHETQVLKDACTLYKQERELLHTGTLYRRDLDGASIEFGIVSAEQDTALFSYNSVVESRRTMPKRFRFMGLDRTAHYKIERVWPKVLKEYSTSVLSKVDGCVFSGEVLMQHGMQMPLTFPQTSLIFKLSRI